MYNRPNATESFAIESRNVKFSIRTKHKKLVHILEDCSIQIPSGQFWMLLGPNGCGKSTLLKVIRYYIVCRIVCIQSFLYFFMLTYYHFREIIYGPSSFSFVSLQFLYLFFVFQLSVNYTDIGRSLVSDWWVYVCEETKVFCLPKSRSSG